MGYSPCGCKESDMIEVIQHACTHHARVHSENARGKIAAKSQVDRDFPGSPVAKIPCS